MRLVVLPYMADDLATRGRAATELAPLASRSPSAWVNAAPHLWIAPLLLLEGRWAELRTRLATVASTGLGDRGWWDLVGALVPLALHQGD